MLLPFSFSSFTLQALKLVFSHFFIFSSIYVEICLTWKTMWCIKQLKIINSEVLLFLKTHSWKISCWSKKKRWNIKASLVLTTNSRKLSPMSLKMQRWASLSGPQEEQWQEARECPHLKDFFMSSVLVSSRSGGVDQTEVWSEEGLGGWGLADAQMLKLSPQPHVPLMLGLLKTNSLDSFDSTKSISVPRRVSWAFFSINTLTPEKTKTKKRSLLWVLVSSVASAGD